MTFEQIIQSLNPEIYRSLKLAIELGKWPDGRKLSLEQKELCMEAVIYYENLHGFEESERVGYIDAGSKKDSSCGTDKHHHEEAPVKILN